MYVGDIAAYMKDCVSTFHVSLITVEAIRFHLSCHLSTFWSSC